MTRDTSDNLLAKAIVFRMRSVFPVSRSGMEAYLNVTDYERERGPLDRRIEAIPGDQTVSRTLKVHSCSF